jgi:hypothetical protein
MAAMRGRVAVFAVLVLLRRTGVAWANDSEAVLEGGVLTFKKSDGITMETEDLTITPDKVEITYLFRNTTDADISTRVAFPLAPYTSDEDAGVYEDLETPEARRQYLHGVGRFTVTVDGKTVAYETSGNVNFKSQQITVTHYWQQRFLAGKTVSVKQSYFPAGCFIYDAQYEKNELWDDLARDYCVGPVLIKAMKKEGTGSVGQVHYILKTGANWKGPIGRFVLRIKKNEAAQKVSLCMDGLRKVDARTFVFEARNFVPTQDLKIAFISLPKI